MTISEIRRRVDALKRRFAPELAIIRLRLFADDRDPDQPPEPAEVIGRIVGAGFCLPTFIRLSRYLYDVSSKGDVPNPQSIVLRLLPWAGNYRYVELLRWDLPAPAR